MPSIKESIEILSKEKGIDPQIVLDAVKDAMLVAARKQFKGGEELAADIDERTGNIVLYALKTVAETVSDPALEISLADARKLDPEAAVGGQVRVPKPTEALGRISAQTAKQVILQKVREAERDNICAEFSGRVGELVNCTVKRLEGPDIVVEIGKAEARLPKKEQSRLESFSIGERVRCVIKSVEKTGKNAGVTVSRAAPELVMRLFEQEVPEIYDGTVVIRGCAREAGERTKIAVLSRDRDVDCVGACVGMKGMRVQSIIRELRGEKIDIIEYSDDPVQFATHALSPARISRISVLDSNEKYMEVIVDDTQLSLAIGKKGQNVRLAAKLLGWRIDIKTEEEKRREVEAGMAAMAIGTPLSVLIDYGLSDQVLEKLLAAGVGSVEKLGAMTPEELLESAGITGDFLQQIGIAVNTWYQHLEAQAQPAGGAAPPAETAPAPPGEEQPAAAGQEPPPAAASAGQESAVEAPVEAAGETETGQVHAGTPIAGELPAGESDTIKSTGLAEEKPAGQ